MLACAPCDPECAEARLLIAELDAALAAICGDSGSGSFDPLDVRGPGSVFLMARDAQGQAVGCGALRPLAPGVAELKRMYAKPGSMCSQRLRLRHVYLAIGQYACRPGGSMHVRWRFTGATGMRRSTITDGMRGASTPPAWPSS